MAPKKKETQAPATPKAKRPPNFAHDGKDEKKMPKSTSLRGKAIARMQKGWASLDDIVALTDEFYDARGSRPKSGTRERAVELVKLVSRKNGFKVEQRKSDRKFRIAG